MRFRTDEDRERERKELLKRIEDGKIAFTSFMVKREKKKHAEKFLREH